MLQRERERGGTQGVKDRLETARVKELLIFGRLYYSKLLRLQDYKLDYNWVMTKNRPAEP